MARTRSGPAHNPLKHFKLENEKNLITMLNVAQLYETEYFHDDFSEAIAHHYRETCSEFGGNDLRSIFSYLKANPEHRDNDYDQLKMLAKGNKYGDGIPEVQDAIRDWDLVISRAKQPK